jgi:hypothetical protein
MLQGKIEKFSACQRKLGCAPQSKLLIDKAGTPLLPLLSTFPRALVFERGTETEMERERGREGGREKERGRGRDTVQLL